MNYAQDTDFKQIKKLRSQLKGFAFNQTQAKEALKKKDEGQKKQGQQDQKLQDKKKQGDQQQAQKTQEEKKAEKEQEEKKKKQAQDIEQQKQDQILKKIKDTSKNAQLFQVICKECYDKRNFLTPQQKKNFNIDKTKQDEFRQQQRKACQKKIQKQKDKQKREKILQDHRDQQKIQRYYKQEKPMYLIPCYYPLDQKQLKALKIQIITFVSGQIFDERNILQMALERVSVHRYIRCETCHNYCMKQRSEQISKESKSQEKKSQKLTDYSYQQLLNGIHGIRWISVPKDPKKSIYYNSYCQKCFLKLISGQNELYGVENFFLVKLMPEISDYDFQSMFQDKKRQEKTYKIENSSSYFVQYDQRIELQNQIKN